MQLCCYTQLCASPPWRTVSLNLCAKTNLSSLQSRSVIWSRPQKQLTHYPCSDGCAVTPETVCCFLKLKYSWHCPQAPLSCSHTVAMSPVTETQVAITAQAHRSLVLWKARRMLRSTSREDVEEHVSGGCWGACLSIYGTESSTFQFVFFPSCC